MHASTEPIRALPTQFRYAAKAKSQVERSDAKKKPPATAYLLTYLATKTITRENGRYPSTPTCPRTTHQKPATGSEPNPLLRNSAIVRHRHTHTHTGHITPPQSVPQQPVNRADAHMACQTQHQRYGDCHFQLPASVSDAA